MDPVLRLWYFENWIMDQKEKIEIAKNHAFLLGSFWNPEAAKNLMDDENNIKLSDEEFEASLDIVRKSREEQEVNQTVKRRGRRTVKV